ncbi:hypothetical protein GIB67_027690 [Kingdonia uniflora]|uniref:Uncharacterized protein n=1 Tax=Kingdonia uniflora TaxID=39325 RepID=A0A7J7NLS2_9MAGN|nr:hypothetical protein GIB67_027690 [Kingdonia uniflora]
MGNERLHFATNRQKQKIARISEYRFGKRLESYNGKLQIWFDMQVLLASQWFIPIIAIFGLFLFVSFWRLRKKQRWRRRGSTGRFSA